MVWLGCSVGESLLIVRKWVIWVGEDGGVLEGMRNEGMGKGGMMEGCGGEWEGVVGVYCRFFDREWV